MMKNAHALHLCSLTWSRGPHLTLSPLQCVYVVCYNTGQDADCCRRFHQCLLCSCLEQRSQVLYKEPFHSQGSGPAAPPASFRGHRLPNPMPAFQSCKGPFHSRLSQLYRSWLCPWFTSLHVQDVSVLMVQSPPSPLQHPFAPLSWLKGVPSLPWLLTAAGTLLLLRAPAACQQIPL